MDTNLYEVKREDFERYMKGLEIYHKEIEPAYILESKWYGICGTLPYDERSCRISYDFLFELEDIVIERARKIMAPEFPGGKVPRNSLLEVMAAFFTGVDMQIAIKKELNKVPF